MPTPKYVIVIPDGAADEPHDSLGGKTALQAANLPAMDRVARQGIVGRSRNVPDRFLPASDVATLSLFGYDPEKYYTGRAPLEAAAMGMTLGPDDWAIRCNLMTIKGGRLADFTAGHITSEEGRPLMEAIHAGLGRPDVGRFDRPAVVGLAGRHPRRCDRLVGRVDARPEQHLREHDDEHAQQEKQDRRVGHLVSEALDAIEHPRRQCAALSRKNLAITLRRQPNRVYLRAIVGQLIPNHNPRVG